MRKSLILIVPFCITLQWVSLDCTVISTDSRIGVNDTQLERNTGE